MLTILITKCFLQCNASANDAVMADPSCHPLVSLILDSESSSGRNVGCPSVDPLIRRRAYQILSRETPSIDPLRRCARSFFSNWSPVGLGRNLPPIHLVSLRRWFPLTHAAYTHAQLAVN